MIGSTPVLDRCDAQHYRKSEDAEHDCPHCKHSGPCGEPAPGWFVCNKLGTTTHPGWTCDLWEEEE